MQEGFWARVSLRKIHPPQEVLEARVGAEGVPGRIITEINHLVDTVLVGFLQPSQGLLFFPGASIQFRNDAGVDTPHTARLYLGRYWVELRP